MFSFPGSRLGTHCLLGSAKSWFFFWLAVVGLSPPSWGQSPIPAGAQLAVEGQVAFTEGPAWHPSGNVYFTDVGNNRIMRRDPKGQLHVFRSPSGRANGLAFDAQGRLICCEGGGPEGRRRVTRTELDGTITVLADRIDSHRLNSPNDLDLDSRGRIYFTDPRYGDTSDVELFDEQQRMIEGVYRIDDVGRVQRIIAHEVDRPNGILVSPDDRYLYVADNVNSGPRAQGGNRKLWRFNLREDGTVDLGSRTMLFDWGTDRGPDGMAIDVQGRLYVTAGFNRAAPPAETSDRFKAGVYVISPGGDLLDFIAIPEDAVTNCAFGGADLKTLYITAGHTLWSIPTDAVGHAELR
jgi:gluconolactonase